MTIQAQEILHSFDLLPEGDKREVVAEIVRRGLAMNIAPLSDDDLVGAAEELFVQLDSCEGSDAS
jgi:hypothetical protein